MTASPEEIRRHGMSMAEDGVGAAISAVEEPLLEATTPSLDETVELVAQVASPESPTSPERPKLKLLKVIAIAGPSFSGKDSVCKILEKRHGWHIYDGSEDGFVRRKDGSGAPIARTQAEHQSFDERQGRKFRDLRTEDEMWVHQTRLGAIILAAEIDERNEELGVQSWDMQEGNLPAQMIEQIPAVGILLYTTDEERLKRAINHEKYLAGKENRRPRSKRAVIAEMRNKEAEEAKSFQRSYGTVQIEDNPYSRWLTRKNGNPVYNRYVLTDNRTPEEVADAVEEMALQLGAAEIIQETQISGGDLAQGEDTIIDDRPHLTHGEAVTYGDSMQIAPARNTEPTLEPA